MRIDTSHIVQRLSGVRSKSLNGLGEAGSPGDSADFSARAADFQAAMESLKAAPEIRESQVAELQQQLQDGSFQVSGDDLARKLLG